MNIHDSACLDEAGYGMSRPGSVTVPLDFTRYVDLLDLHGLAAHRAFAALTANDSMPPRGDRADEVATDHWATLEIWLWILTHPHGNWQGRTPPVRPRSYEDTVAALPPLLAGLEQHLMAAGPDVEVDFFGQPGTTLDVARLLAHEAIARSRSASRAADRQEPPLDPDVAADGIDRALTHWSEARSDLTSHPAPVLIEATDVGASWWLRFGSDDRLDTWSFTFGPPGDPAVRVVAPAVELLGWLEAYDPDTVTVEGDPPVVRTLALALDHPLPDSGKRWWRRG